MAERTKPEKVSEEERNAFGNYSPEHIARIINASLFNKPGDSAALSALIEHVHQKEQFVLLLMKVIDPPTSAFFDNIIGICETRKKEVSEKKQLDTE